MNSLLGYEKQERPWGNFERLTLNELSTVKVITVSPLGKLSLQRHAHREEVWRVLSGEGVVTIDASVIKAKSGDIFVIPVGSTHRLEASDEGIVILEIARGEFDENDIERIEDVYGRI